MAGGDAGTRHCCRALIPWGCRAWSRAFISVGVSTVHPQPSLNTLSAVVSLYLQQAPSLTRVLISLILPSGLWALRSRRQKVRSQLQRQAFNYRERFQRRSLDDSHHSLQQSASAGRL